jgi:GntR family transcriptional regulator
LADAELRSYTVNKRSPVPKYYQLRAILRELIRDWSPDQLIPSESELCQTYDVSRTTVRKALDYLIYEGLLYRVQGKGTFVSPQKLQGCYVQDSIGFFEDMEARGLSHRTEVLEQDIIEAGQTLANHLQIQAGEEVFHMTRLQFVEDEILHLAVSHVPQKLCPGLIDEDFTNKSLYRTMQQKYQLKPHHGTRIIEVQYASPNEAKLLKLPHSAPVLVVIGTMYDVNDVPIEYGIAKNRADRSQFQIKVIPREQLDL